MIRPVSAHRQGYGGHIHMGAGDLGSNLGFQKIGDRNSSQDADNTNHGEEFQHSDGSAVGAMDGLHGREVCS
jgi:hypothetical protein